MMELRVAHVVMCSFIVMHMYQLDAQANVECRVFREASRTEGLPWDPKLGPFEFTLNFEGIGLSIYRLFEITPLELIFRRQIFVSKLGDLSVPDVIAWRDQDQVILAVNDNVQNDEVERTFSVSISDNGIVTMSELAQDGTSRQLFTYEDTSLDTAVTFYVKYDYTSELHGAKFCNAHPPLISQFKEASQSSDSAAALAFKAVNGFLYPFPYTQCAHTDMNENSWWWRVDLGKEYLVKVILVFANNIPFTTPETEDVILVASRIENFPSDSFTCGVVNGAALNLPNNPTAANVCPDNTIGQYVQIMDINDSQKYGLCEVQVFGIEVPAEMKTFISFTQSAYKFSEGESVTAIEVIRTGDINKYSAIDVVSEGNTAISEKDFDAFSKTVEFLIGEETKTEIINIIDDQVAEYDEHFTLKLNGVEGGEIGTIDRASVTIYGNDGPQYFFPTSLYSALESDTFIRIDVQRTLETLEETTIGLNLRRITAQVPEDFDDSPLDVEFAPNAETTTVMMPINDNHEVDDDRTFEVSLDLRGVLGSIDLARNQATATIKNDDVRHYMDFPSISVYELEKTFSVVVKRYGYLEEETSITVQTKMLSNSAKEGDDYIAVNEKVTFDPNKESQELKVTLIDDDKVESEESFEIQLTGNDYELDNDRKKTTVVVKDEDVSYSFDRTTYSVKESDLRISIDLLRSGNLSQETQAYVSTADDTAVGFSDYQSLSHFPVQFSPGQINAVFAVDIEDDKLVEGKESFTVSVKSSIITDVTGTSAISITDDDATFTFIQSTSEVEEANGIFTSLVQRETSNINVPGIVRITSSTGSASELDVAIIDMLVVIPAGQTASTFTVDIVIDDVVEENEQFTLTLSAVDEGILGEYSSLTVTIIDTTKLIPANKGLGGAAIAGIVIGSTVGVAILLTTAAMAMLQFMRGTSFNPTTTDTAISSPYPNPYLGNNWYLQ